MKWFSGNMQMWRNLEINGFNIQHACGFAMRMEQEHSCNFVYSSRDKRECHTYKTILMLRYSLLLIGALFLFMFRYFARSDVGVQAKRVLFVTAHPDDEVMFFAPTLITLAKKDPNMVYILCLSEGLGFGRDMELKRVVDQLKIPRSNLLIANFTDGQKVSRQDIVFAHG